MTIEKNVIVMAETEEQMQGIIRGIEALDTDHKIGIIHGTYGKLVDEIVLILAELAQATILHTPSIKQAEHPQGKEVQYKYIIAPVNVDREAVIDYIKLEYPNLIEELLN